MSGPYGISALTYYEAGFSPLPALGKLLVVKNASGRHPVVSKSQIERWSITHGPFSVALRVPKNVLGLDVDAYKGDLKKLEALEDSLGKLPLTWNSDSRGGDGGKILYKIPDHLLSDKWISNINGITVVQHTHRYVMAFPSYNKESQSRYLWYLGLGGDLIPNQIPAVDDLTELPESWIETLRKQVDLMHDYDTYAMNNDLDLFNDDAPCPYMETLIQMCKDKLIASYDGGLHDTANSVLGIVIMAAVNGHAGVAEAVEGLSKVFCDGPRQRDLGSEWDSMLSYILPKIDPDTISESDTCKLSIDWQQIKENAEKDFNTEFAEFGLTSQQKYNLQFGSKKFRRAR